MRGDRHPRRLSGYFGIGPVHLLASLCLWVWVLPGLGVVAAEHSQACGGAEQATSLSSPFGAPSEGEGGAGGLTRPWLTAAGVSCRSTRPQ